MEKEYVEMKVVNVDFVENEMMELDVVQIGSNWGWSGDENDYGGDECGDKCGDGHAEKTKLAAILPNPLYPPNNTPNNQSKPIVSTPSLSPITFHYDSYNFSL